MSDMEDIIRLRKAKKILYGELLRRGLGNLTDREKDLLRLLSLDDDIVLLLINGTVFERE